MKKKYESPMVEKYEFNYVENVVASEPEEESGDPAIAGLKEGKTGHAVNSCYRGNQSDMGNSINNCNGKIKG